MGRNWGKRNFFSTLLGERQATKFIKHNKIPSLYIHDNSDHFLHFCISTDVTKKRDEEQLRNKEVTKMVINCSLSTFQESVMHYARQFIDLPPLPAYITKNGPYVENEGGGKRQIIICYEFDKSKFVEAMENICKQLGAFHDVPGFALIADLYGPHPFYLIVEEGAEV